MVEKSKLLHENNYPQTVVKYSEVEIDVRDSSTENENHIYY